MRNVPDTLAIASLMTRGDCVAPVAYSPLTLMFALPNVGANVRMVSPCTGSSAVSAPMSMATERVSASSFVESKSAAEAQYTLLSLPSRVVVAHLPFYVLYWEG